MAKNTDVHGSVAGYYYQVLLACRELTKLKNEGDCVGVECGADIRIMKNGKKTSIESKFHKGKMGLYDPDIVKTIYNFYRYSSNDEKLYFNTNVTMTGTKGNELLTNDWNNPLKKNERINFIKRCILKHSISHCMKDEFEKYKKELCKNNGKKEDIKDSDYLENLEKEIFEENKKEYKMYAYFDDTVDYNSLADKIEFKFEDKDKELSICDLRSQILESIKNNFLKEKESDDVINGIIDALVYKFFFVITINSKKDNPSFDELDKVSINDLKDCIKNYEEMLDKYNSVCELANILRAFEQEESIFIEILDEEYSGNNKELLLQKYKFIRNIFQKYISDEKNFDNLIKTYSIGDKISWDSILKVISICAIISVYKGVNENNINFLKKDYSINNVFIDETIEFCFKNFPYIQSVSAKYVVKKFLSTIQLSEIKDNQIVVLSTAKGFQNGDKPCQQRKNINSTFINSISEANREYYQKYFKMIDSINYKCDECIICNKPDEIIIEKLTGFFTKCCEVG